MSTTKRFLSSEHTMIISASAGAQTIHRDLGAVQGVSSCFYNLSARNDGNSSFNDEEFF